MSDTDHLTSFLNEWNQADKKQAIIEELTEQGVIFEEYQRSREQRDGYI